jgi:hypothetical protein
LPRIVGEVVATETGSSILGVMLLERWIRPFLLFWITSVAVLSLATILFQIFMREFHVLETLVPPVPLGCGIGFLRYLRRDFMSQTESEIRYLAELFGASAVERTREADDSPTADG